MPSSFAAIAKEEVKVSNKDLGAESNNRKGSHEQRSQERRITAHMIAKRNGVLRPSKQRIRRDPRGFKFRISYHS